MVCCAPWAVLQATDRGLRQVAALSCSFMLPRQCATTHTKRLDIEGVDAWSG